MPTSRNRATATLLSVAYLLLALAGEGLHVHGPVEGGHGLAGAQGAAEGLAAHGCGCGHTCSAERLPDAESSEPAFAEQRPAPHDCLACHLRALLKTANAPTKASVAAMVPTTSLTPEWRWFAPAPPHDWASARGPPARV